MSTALAALRQLETKSYGNQITYPVAAGPGSLPSAFSHIVCHDETFIKTLKTAAKVAPTQAAIFINGESGVGKELIVEAIHLHGKGSSRPFVKINCAAIPNTLFESELFGYEKGAFTGAAACGKKGRLELAHGGTLFLDEIGELPLGAQAKLLRVLQEKEIERVGGTAPIKVEFRLVTATNRNLEEMVHTGSFREDLYYRLHVIRLTVPPLRHRKHDIPTLVQVFLAQMQQQYGAHKDISAQALQALARHNWPGNVRELKNVIEQAYILCEKQIIQTNDLPERINSYPASSFAVNTRECYNLGNIIAKAEREAISAVLQLTGNNKTKASEMLGISRRCFYQKLDKYGLA